MRRPKGLVPPGAAALPLARSSQKKARPFFCSLSLTKPHTSKNLLNYQQRYDLLSTGLGALCVTGYCVARGQEPGVAASITVTATITALVLNELLFTDNGSGSSGSSSDK